MASSDITAEVVGGSIGEAYTRALGSRLGGLFPHRYRLIHIAEPITSLDTIPDTLEWEAWRDIVHAGEVLSTFEDFEFTDSSTGRLLGAGPYRGAVQRSLCLSTHCAA